MNTRRRTGWTLLALGVFICWFFWESNEAPHATNESTVKNKSSNRKSRPTELAPRAFPPPPSIGRDEYKAWKPLSREARNSWAPLTPTVTPKLIIAPVIPLAPPAALAPPPFPYSLIGRLESEGKIFAILSGADRSNAVEAGQVIDEKWKVQELNDRGLVLVWLATRQLKNISYAQ